MRTLVRLTLASCALFLLPAASLASTGIPTPPPDSVGGTARTCPWNPGSGRACPCPYDTSTEGVLIPHRFQPGTPYFSCYVATFLKVNWLYVTLFAVVLVMWSGFEYLISGGDGGKQKAAKQRVIGVFTGLILYFVIQFIVPLLLGSARV